MKKITLFLALITVFNSCKTDNKEAEIVVVDSITVEATPELSIGDITSEKFLNELLGQKGMVRGFDFGTPVSDILKAESLELFEEKPGHVGFVYERENLESADFLYMRDADNKLNGVDIDIYLNTPASSDALFATAKSHYNSLYKPSPTDSLTWMIPPKGYVRVSQIKKPLDNGLEIKYRKQ